MHVNLVNQPLFQFIYVWKTLIGCLAPLAPMVIAGSKYSYTNLIIACNLMKVHLKMELCYSLMQDININPTDKDACTNNERATNETDVSKVSFHVLYYKFKLHP